MILLGYLVAATWTVSEGELIQDAIAHASDGDTIEVGPGRYLEHLDFLGKDILLRSTDGPVNTILDGQDTWDTSVVSFQTGEPLSATLQGFTVTGGHGQPYIWDAGKGWLGGGVYIEEAGATISNCIFLDNNARHSGQSHGGALAVINGQALVRDSTFRNNLGFYGGGAMGVVSSQVVVEGNHFEGNRGTHGGAVIVLQTSSVDFQANQWVDNQGGHGGHLFVRNSAITSNLDEFRGGRSWHNGGAIALEGASALMNNTTLVDSEAAHDGGHFWIARSSHLEMAGSYLELGRATAGGAFFTRSSSSLLLEGVAIVDHIATESGAALWAAGSEIVGINLTIQRGAAPQGAVAFLHNSSLTGVNTLLLEGLGESQIHTLGTPDLNWSYGLFHGHSGELAGGTLTEVQGSSLSNADPLLDDTLQPAPGSPAIDQGHPAILDTDGSASDLGARGGRRPWSP